MIKYLIERTTNDSIFEKLYLGYDYLYPDDKYKWYPQIFFNFILNENLIIFNSQLYAKDWIFLFKNFRQLHNMQDIEISCIPIKIPNLHNNNIFYKH